MDTTPVTSDPAADHPFVETLNVTFGLEIKASDPRLSPEKQQAALRLRSEGEKRAAKIYSLIRYLGYQTPDPLSAIETQFRGAAKVICSQWVSKPRAVPGLLPSSNAIPRATTPDQRKELELCLLNLLQQARQPTARRLFTRTPKDVPIAGTAQPALASRPGDSRQFRKRHSDEAEIVRARDGPSVSKRAKSALDQVPVRGKIGQVAINRSFQLSRGEDSRSFLSESTFGPADTTSAETSYTSIFSATNRIADDTIPSDSQLTQPFDDEDRLRPGPKTGIISATTAFYLPEDLRPYPSLADDPADGDAHRPSPHSSYHSRVQLPMARTMPMEQSNRTTATTTTTTTTVMQGVGLERGSGRTLGIYDNSGLSNAGAEYGASEISACILPLSSQPSLSVALSSQGVAFREPPRPAQGTPIPVPSFTSSFDVDFEPGERVLGPHFALDQRLEDSWPKLPKDLADAPLAIMWEVTRAALYCGVDLGDLGLKYNVTWKNQAVFRDALLSDPCFRDKKLPTMCSPSAWEASLSTFQQGGRTISLIMEATYNPTTTGPFFLLTLEPLALSLGHRLDRRFGSDRFLEVIFPSHTSEKAPAILKEPGAVDCVNRWISQHRHVLLGRIWRGFFLRDAKKQVKEDEFFWKRVKYDPKFRVHMFCEDGNEFERSSLGVPFPPRSQAVTPRIRTRMKLSHLMEWAIGITGSRAQKSLKLFSRLALSLTPSTATVVLRPDQIIHHPDDVRSATGQVMNDGIGRMSRAMALKVAQLHDLDVMPAAFQGRIGSAKGLWIVDGDSYYDGDDAIWIETYPSQRKWECDFEDQDHRTFEVKDFSRELKPASLNKQFITVLEDRAIDAGVMRERLGALLRTTVRDELDSRAIAATNPLAFQRWVDVNPFDRTERISHGVVPFLAGLPNSDEEALKFLLDGGFHPRELKYIRDLVYNVAKKKHEALQSKLKVQVPRSTYAYMVVDFSGRLKENEVHMWLSSSFHTECGESETILHNVPVLVARAPAHFPSDIQKVKAVFHPELRHLKNVVVFSSQGNSPLADMLSGGDYDGDKAWVCWDPTIVNNFRNAPVPKKPDLRELGYLRVDSQTFEGTMAKYPRRLDIAVSHFLFDGFVFTMQGDLLGQCTNYKEKICYRNNSIRDEAAVVLSSLVSDLVDRAKQGITFTEADWTRLKKDLIPGSIRPPEPPAYIERDSGGPGNHILDWLKFQVIKPTVESELKAFEASLGQPEHYDPDLVYYFRELENLANGTLDGARPAIIDPATASRTYSALRNKLCKDLYAVADMWKDTIATGTAIGYADRVRLVHQTYLDIRPNPVSLDRLPVKTWLFGTDSSTPDGISTWGKVKASFFFKLYHKNPKLVFTLAGAHLQAIKAERCIAREATSSARPPIAIIPSMYAAHRPDKRIITALGRNEGDTGDTESLADVLNDYYFDGEGNEIEHV